MGFALFQEVSFGECYDALSQRATIGTVVLGHVEFLMSVGFLIRVLRGSVRHCSLCDGNALICMHLVAGSTTTKGRDNHNGRCGQGLKRQSKLGQNGWHLDTFEDGNARSLPQISQ